MVELTAASQLQRRDGEGPMVELVAASPLQRGEEEGPIDELVAANPRQRCEEEGPAASSPRWLKCDCCDFKTIVIVVACIVPYVFALACSLGTVVLVYGVLIYLSTLPLGVRGGLPGLPGCAWWPGGQEVSKSSWLGNGLYPPTVNGTRSAWCRNTLGQLSNQSGWFFSANASVASHGVWLNASPILVEPLSNASAWQAALPGCYDLHATDATTCGDGLAECVSSCALVGLHEPILFWNWWYQVEVLGGAVPLDKVCVKATTANGFCFLPGMTIGNVVVSFGVLASMLYTILSVGYGTWTSLRRPSKPKSNRVFLTANFSAAPWTWFVCRCGISQMSVDNLFLRDHILSGLFMVMDRYTDVLSSFVYGRSGQPYYVILNVVSILRSRDPLQILHIRAWWSVWQRRAPTTEFLRGKWHEGFYEGGMSSLIPAASTFTIAQVNGGNVPWAAAGPLLFSMCSSLFSVFTAASAIEIEAALKVRFNRPVPADAASDDEGAGPTSFLTMMAVQKKIQIASESFILRCQILRVCEILSLLPVAALVATHGCFGALALWVLALLGRPFFRTLARLSGCLSISASPNVPVIEVETSIMPVRDEGVPILWHFADLALKPLDLLVPPFPVSFIEPLDGNIGKRAMHFRAVWGLSTPLAVPLNYLLNLIHHSFDAISVSSVLSLQLPGRILFLTLLGIGYVANIVMLCLLRFDWDCLMADAKKIREALEEFKFTEDAAVEFLEHKDVAVLVPLTQNPGNTEMPELCPLLPM